MSPQRKRVFSDRYEAVSPIARGGMAEVWLAHDGLLDRTVALKVLFKELSVDPNFVERFRREAQSAANLSHPNIVSVYDWGESAGTYFIVMEYIDGRPLSAVLRDGPLDPMAAAEIAAEVAAALGFAHRHGVIHRDVKPGNVLLTGDGHVKVTDFGIARAANTEDHLTQTGAVMGTATYFSPEQAQGIAVDPRSDVYALGVVLYEMVTGSPPFVAESPVATAYKHVHEEPARPTALKPTLPPALEAIIMQALAKDPARRYASAEELRADLMRFRQGRTVLAEPPAGVTEPAPKPRAPRPVRPPRVPDAAAPAAPATVASATIPEALPDAEPEPARSLHLYVITLLVLVAALVIVLVLLARQLNLFDNGGGGGSSSAAIGATTTTAAPGPTVYEPDVLGEDDQTATQQLQQAGFTVAPPVAQDSTNVQAGNVMSQNPPAGSDLPSGQAITLTVSDGKGQALIPDESGRGETTAESDLQKDGLTTYVDGQDSSASVPDGSVVRTVPAAGVAVSKGSSVGLVLSTGPGEVHVPYVRDEDLSTAKSELQSDGLEVTVTQESTPYASDDGVVLAVDPAGGTLVEQGSTVNLTVGQFSSSSSDGQ